MSGLYRTICVDPPWLYKDTWRNNPHPARPGSGGAFRGGARIPLAYPALTVEQIAALPVAALAEQQAHLYLWTTNRYLRDAFDVLKGWGFRYAQTLIWAKAPRGFGAGGAFAQNAEFILFGRRGTLAQKTRLDSVWFNWKRTARHSQKPEAFQDMVEQVSPGPYLELFARRPRLGWDVWGNEVESTIALPMTGD